MRDLSVQIENMKRHIEADELVRGVGFESGEGCFVGCTIDAYDHDKCAEVTGVPKWVWRFCDTLHENMSDGIDRGDMALRLLKGFERVEEFKVLWHDICAFIQQRNLDRVKGMDITSDLKAQVIAVIETVLTLHLERSDDEAAWLAAESAAWSAESAAESAAWSAAWSAEFDIVGIHFLSLLEAGDLNG
jgi:hypothetical protein